MHAFLCRRSVKLTFPILTVDPLIHRAQDREYGVRDGRMDKAAGACNAAVEHEGRGERGIGTEQCKCSVGIREENFCLQSF